MNQRITKKIILIRFEKENERFKPDRGKVRLKGFNDIKLLNLFNHGGIRF